MIDEKNYKNIKNHYHEKNFVILVSAFFKNSAYAQTDNQVYTQAEAQDMVLRELGGDVVRPYSQDEDAPTEYQRIGYPKRDYAFFNPITGCQYIAHFYRHSIGPVAYGSVYEIDELIACP